ncbi:MAG: 50S ribosomal protein L30, partial [Candidatus Altiarchaeales archaeon ex4484_96]
LADTPQNRGMLNKVKDYVTWGEIDKEILVDMLKKRGRLAGNRRIDDDYMKKTPHKSIDKLADDLIKSKTTIKSTEIKPVFRLRPPVKGYERGGIKKPYTLGGALGYRKKQINNLLERMI